MVRGGVFPVVKGNRHHQRLHGSQRLRSAAVSQTSFPLSCVMKHALALFAVLSLAGCAKQIDGVPVEQLTLAESMRACGVYSIVFA